jgi:hypothetical protein
MDETHFTFGVVDTEGTPQTLHDVCIVVVPMKDMHKTLHPIVNVPVSANTIGRYAAALGETFKMCNYIFAHNKSTDFENLKWSLERTGWGNEMPEENVWIDSLSFLRGLRNNASCKIFEGAPKNMKNDLGSIYRFFFGESIVERHTAAADALALTRILKHACAREPKLFALNFSETDEPKALSHALTFSRGASPPPPSPAPFVEDFSAGDGEEEEEEAEIVPVANERTCASLAEALALAEGNKIKGPLTVTCSVTLARSGGYFRIFDAPLAKQPTATRKDFRIPPGCHVLVVDEKLKSKSFASMTIENACLGVYVATDKFVRIK